MLARSRLLLCAACVFVLCFWRAPDASAFSGATGISYNWEWDYLSGYTATWADWWDAQAGFSCNWWDWDPEFGYYCASQQYWENVVSVVGYAYTPSGGLAANAYRAGWPVADLYLGPFAPWENGTWTHIGYHYVETSEWTQDGQYWYFLGTFTTYLGQSGQQASNSCGDGDLDGLIRWYRVYNVRPIPTCDVFRNFPRSAMVSAYFTWGDFNHPEDNPHNWAIVSGRTIAGVDYTQYLYGDGLRITSGYRSPDVTGGASYYHMWGRAADQKAYWWPVGPVVIAYEVWYPLFNMAQAAGAEWVEPYDYDPPSSRTHVHSRWPYGF